MRRHSVLSGLASLLVGLVASVAPGWGADYGGPLIDAHSHLPNSTAIDAYVAAMKRHNVLKVVLLGVGGLQKDDTAWLTAASKKYPDRVVAGLPLPDPTSESAVSQLELQLERGKPRVIGEVHMRQVGRRLIDRDEKHRNAQRSGEHTHTEKVHGYSGIVGPFWPVVSSTCGPDSVSITARPLSEQNAECRPWSSSHRTVAAPD